ncbi:HAD family hydrolase [Geitlerinema sp. P-1104]|uniref:HAD family hydrolase n=1 Tax=Geitlerinema sp. P-1104 TaxID=2546230 RepID=UPI001477534D|nr:HAD family hydrolase [Geitlerinema sp. P-1104]NMG59531.1 HAD family hydrolase [Geitlerinema sp. P-1104]
MTRAVAQDRYIAQDVGLIADFDGPIADVSERYYRVYHECLDRMQDEDTPIQRLSKSEFWGLKRARVPEQEIGKRSGLNPEQARKFAKLRRQLVHSQPYLKYDQLIPGAIAALDRAQEAGIELTLMTMRRERELAEALSRFDVGRFFPDERRYCMGDDDVKTADTRDKPRLMARAMTELPQYERLWMVGDTEADAIAANSQGIQFIGVLSGIRDRPSLQAHHPYKIVNTLSDAVDVLLDTLSVNG